MANEKVPNKEKVEKAAPAAKSKGEKTVPAAKSKAEKTAPESKGKKAAGAQEKGVPHVCSNGIKKNLYRR